MAASADIVCLLENRIAEKVGPQRFKIWFKHTTQFTVGDDFLRIGVPNQYVGSWIENHFSDTISQAAHEVTGRELQVSYCINPLLSREMPRKQADRQADYMASNPERYVRQAKQGGTVHANGHLKGRLDTFVVGDSNRLAFETARSVIENPATRYNPLFVHGACGLGKTHLLQAICNGIMERDPAAQCLYITAEEFTNQFVYAIRNRQRDAFRHRFRHVDVLAIDDIHFLSNKKGTQDEFLHTFNAIEAVGKQVILASDAHPKMIGQLSESLVNRFLSGVVVRIDSPDLETRQRILQHRAASLQKQVPEPVIRYIAENLKANVRELEGALLKLLACSSFGNQPLTVAMAEKALSDHIIRTTPLVRLSDIENCAALYFGLTASDLHTSRKTRTIALARNVAMYLARKHTELSYPEIGRFMGKKNHATVILANRKIKTMHQQDGAARWVSAAGEAKEKPIREIIADLEHQLGEGDERGKRSFESAA